MLKNEIALRKLRTITINQILLFLHQIIKYRYESSLFVFVLTVLKRLKNIIKKKF